MPTFCRLHALSHKYCIHRGIKLAYDDDDVSETRPRPTLQASDDTFIQIEPTKIPHRFAFHAKTTLAFFISDITPLSLRTLSHWPFLLSSVNRRSFPRALAAYRSTCPAHFSPLSFPSCFPQQYLPYKPSHLGPLYLVPPFSQQSIVYPMHHFPCPLSFRNRQSTLLYSNTNSVSPDLTKSGLKFSFVSFTLFKFVDEQCSSYLSWLVILPTLVINP